MQEDVFQTLREIILQESGISLSDEKKSLLATRIGKRLRALKLEDAQDYLSYLKSNERELEKLIDVVSTNVTHFFREPAHFAILEDYFRALAENNSKSIRVWCAASSSGEEPYSIAITAAEVFNSRKIDFKLLATDICTDVLEHALAGIYDTEKLEKIPKQMRMNYFEQLPKTNKDETQFRVKQDIKNKIVFKRLNLSRLPLPLKGPLDAIFCRNVMIYFSIELRKKLIADFYRLLAPGGYLFLGHSENLLGIEHRFKLIRSSTYVK